ncbi:MAG: hypothetical protein J0M13_16735 [Candidatus Accumulibacter sp.]|jgi:hypothetical protein|nr:hypothetical protein [Candidatus Accumulibacter necessarius]
MQIRINQRSACLVLVLASAAVSAADEGVGGVDQAGLDVVTPLSRRSAGLLLVAADTLPKSRDALFADDEPATESPPAESRESLFGNDEPGQPQAAEPPASRDSLFGDDQRQQPGTASATSSAAAGFKGFVQNVMAYTYAKPAHWSEMMTRVDLSAQGDLGSNIKWKLGARVDYDATFTFTDFYPQAVADNQRFNVLLRENYLDIGAGDWDFRVGRQQIVWGEMVGLLFGDVVSAKDMRHFILPEFEILRIPQWAARAEYFKDDFHLELLWIPVASYDNIGKPGSEFYSYTLVPYPEATFRNEKFPTRNLSNTNYGLRLSVLRDGWDVAAFAYSSMSVAPTFYREIRAGLQPTVIYQARHDRIDQFGTTLAKDLGSLLLKAEAVYTRGRGYEVTNLTDPDGVVFQNNLTWVIGLDYTELADTRINFQIFQSHVFDRDPDIIPSTNENGYSLLVNHKFGDKVEAQALWVSSLNRTDWMLRPRVSWNFEKNWRLAFGVDIFNGPPLGYFGRYDNRDRVYTEIRYSF